MSLVHTVLGKRNRELRKQNTNLQNDSCKLSSRRPHKSTQRPKRNPDSGRRQIHTAAEDKSTQLLHQVLPQRNFTATTHIQFHSEGGSLQLVPTRTTCEEVGGLDVFPLPLLPAEIVTQNLIFSSSVTPFGDCGPKLDLVPLSLLPAEIVAQS